MQRSLASRKTSLQYWPYVAAFLLAITVRGVTALQMSGPENLDAEYYLLLAQNLASGKGLAVDAIWHFLDNPQGFPHPAGAVWLPAASYVQSAGLWLGSGYRYAQLPQVLLSGGLVVMAMRVGFEAARRWSDAWTAALLTVCGGGTVAVRHIDTDCYASYALAGALALYALYRGQSSPRWLGVSGLFIGLASLTRPDGHLLFVIFILYLVVLAHRRIAFSRAAAGVASILYLLVNLPWWLRNVTVFGQVSPVSALAPALLREYGEFFAYQSQPTWQHFLSWGWQWQARSKLAAALGNVARLAWVFQVWELPVIALGVWTVRQQIQYLPIIAFPVLLHLAMSLVYTFPGQHGSFLHSIGAFVPFGAAFCALGLRRMADRAASFVPVHRRQAATLAVFVAAALVSVVWGQAIARAELASNRSWTRGQQALASWITANARPGAVIMSNVGIGVTLRTGHPTLTIPFGDIEGLLRVAQRYRAEYLAVSLQRQQALPDNALHQFSICSEFELMHNGDNLRIYRIALPEIAREQDES